MTPEQKAFEAVIKERLAERARLLLATDQRTVALLRDALVQIHQQINAQPADWKLWQLTRLRDQLDTVLTAVGTQAGTAASLALGDAWQQGEDFVDMPLAAAGQNLQTRLGPLLDVRVLSAMRTFTTDRMKDVTAQAAGKIAQQLGLVTIGGITPFEAIKAVEGILGAEAARRATTIIHTEVPRAFAVAGNERLAQAAPLVPGLGKQWRRSGKIHSRWNHDIMDGQVVPADKPFKVPNPGGGFDMMQCPHDPTAPIEQIINCGCVCLPWLKGWQVMTPGAKPFTKKELQLDKRKADLDRQAKAAGRRREGAAG